MPRGLGQVRKAVENIEAKRAAAEAAQKARQSPRALFFKLQDGQETVVRFADTSEEIGVAYCHEIPIEGRSWGQLTPCMDQDESGIKCLGCEAELPRKFQGFINLIWDDAPVLKRNEKGWVEKDVNGNVIVLGTKPQMAVWQSGVRVYEKLDEIDMNYRGLMSRRFKIKRKGKKLETTYSITPEEVDGGPQDLSAEEKAMLSEKFDLNEFITPKSAEDWEVMLGQSAGNGGGDTAVQESAEINPFMRKQ